MEDAIAHLFKWQTFYGAALGAATPIVVYILAERHKSHTAHKQYLVYVLQALGDQIETVVNARDTIKSFVNGPLTNHIKQLEHPAPDTYHIGSLFIPAFSARPLSEDVLRGSTRSAYVYNKIRKVFTVSANFSRQMDDLRYQLNETLRLNEQLVLNKGVAADVQRRQLAENMRNFRDALQQTVLETNMPIFLELFVVLKTAIEVRLTNGYFRWNQTFNVSWNFY